MYIKSYNQNDIFQFNMGVTIQILVKGVNIVVPPWKHSQLSQSQLDDSLSGESSFLLHIQFITGSM